MPSIFFSQHVSFLYQPTGWCLLTQEGSLALSALPHSPLRNTLTPHVLHPVKSTPKSKSSMPSFPTNGWLSQGSVGWVYWGPCESVTVIDTGIQPICWCSKGFSLMKWNKRTRRTYSNCFSHRHIPEWNSQVPHINSTFVNCKTNRIISNARLQIFSQYATGLFQSNILGCLLTIKDAS